MRTDEIKKALNAVYGLKPLTDTVFKRATDKDLDLSNPNNVVLALYAAYQYMYYRAQDEEEGEAVLAKQEELFNIYDLETGKFLEDLKGGPSTVTDIRLCELEKSVENLVKNTNEALVAIENLKKQDAGIKNRLYKLERWKDLSTEDDK